MAAEDRARADGPLRTMASRIRDGWPYYGNSRRKGAHNVAERHFNLTHPGMRRSVNQDQVTTTALPGGRMLLLVADGVGGAGGGEVASEVTLESIVGTLKDLATADPPHALREAVRVANARVRTRAATDERLSSMATTLVAAVIAGDDAWIINVGDSRAYLFSDGAIEPLTEDDSWVAEQVRSGALTPDEATRSPYQNVITRGVGVEETINVDTVTRIALKAGQMLMLCSDGLYRCVSPEVIAETMAGASLETAGRRLVELANEAGGPDNISVALYRH